MLMKGAHIVQFTLHIWPYELLHGSIVSLNSVYLFRIKTAACQSGSVEHSGGKRTVRAYVEHHGSWLLFSNPTPLFYECLPDSGSYAEKGTKELSSIVKRRKLRFCFHYTNLNTLSECKDILFDPIRSLSHGAQNMFCRFSDATMKIRSSFYWNI